MSASALGRRLTALAGTGLLATVLLVLGAAPASAHSVLLATTPASSGQVPSAPDAVVLTFNEMPRGQYSDIHVLGPDGARRDSGHVKVLNDTVTEALGGSRPAGSYTVDWRVISTDGHPVSGQFTFVAASAAAALAPPQPDSGTSGSANSGNGSTGIVIAVVVIVVLVAGVLASFLVRRARRLAPESRGVENADGD